MRALDAFSFNSAVTANSPVFFLEGGAYCVDVIADFNSGSITLERLGPDNGTYITAVTALTANGTSGAIALPEGQYQFAVVGASAIFAVVSRIPGE